MRIQIIGRWLVAFCLVAAYGCRNSGTSSDGASSSSGSSTSSTSHFFSPPPVVIDAGTPLVVTIDQTISTKTNKSGDSFEASLAEPVTVGGREVLPTGTKAVGTVTQSAEAGHLKGGAALVLTLDSLTVHGDKYAIETGDYAESGKGRGKRTAVGAGGGAALGAVVGALAGGGKGAAIGAVAGGGAGTAGAAYTGNRDITIPAETRVKFKLSQAVTIKQ